MNNETNERDTTRVSAADQRMTPARCVFDGRFPRGVVATTLSLMRRRLRLSREMVDDVVRTRGHVNKELYCYSNGVLFCKIPYFDGKQHGLSRGWHLNGACYWVDSYVDGKRHGLSREWYTNGTRHWEISYVDGEPHGLLRWWRKDESLE